MIAKLITTIILRFLVNIKLVININGRVVWNWFFQFHKELS